MTWLGAMIGPHLKQSLHSLVWSLERRSDLDVKVLFAQCVLVVLVSM